MFRPKLSGCVPLRTALHSPESVTRNAWRASSRYTTRSMNTSARSCWSCSGLDFNSLILELEHKEVRDMFRFTQNRMLIVFAISSLMLFGRGAFAQEVPGDYQDVLKALDRKGDFKAGVLKVNIPRNDLKMTIQGVATPTPFGFGGWVALTKGADGAEVMMGDLVLLQEEVNPVMSALLDNGIEVTALHNHFFWDDPHVYFMHVHGMGKAADLAKRIKTGLDLIGHSPAAAAVPGGGGSPETLDTAKIAKIVGHEGEKSGAVYKITVGRDDLNMKEHGATINARMGL